ncbi:hypothetical protein MPH_09117 [Macrophomina phaseolina MS6]|uniref:Uncharacterized protein n=1 Tax=Macrophomina phaseolina (strain MS6) TaxID=1126212 RepID=K2RLG5_MACPH|nr:hypothetical protein MPH_09117 [Macrophomina phaseolina MS6]
MRTVSSTLHRNRFGLEQETDLEIRSKSIIVQILGLHTLPRPPHFQLVQMKRLWSTTLQDAFLGVVAPHCAHDAAAQPRLGLNDQPPHPRAPHFNSGHARMLPRPSLPPLRCLFEVCNRRLSGGVGRAAAPRKPSSANIPPDFGVPTALSPTPFEMSKMISLRGYYCERRKQIHSVLRVLGCRCPHESTWRLLLLTGVPFTIQIGLA